LEKSLVVEQIAFGGKGLGRLDSGKVCFVPGVIPGERVVVRIQRERASYAEAGLERVVEASPDRIAPECRVYGRCGGCRYQHITYEGQLEIKRGQVADVLRRLGGVADVKVEPTVPSPDQFGYRNRVTVHVRRGVVGFFSEGSNRVVNVTRCPIATAAVNALLADLRASRPRDGEYPLREPGEFRGFRQVNDGAAQALQEVVADFAAPGGGLLVDAYCGAGFFAKRLRTMFRLVIGIEWSTDAVRAARENTRAEEIYLLGDVQRHLPAALGAAEAAETTVLLDPPAEGLTDGVADQLLVREPARLLYVSCDPATLARDLRRLSQKFRVVRVRPVDMFPQTAEVEVATLLEKR
jgi:23S rRNA (uracil1939-C5)-methyltransferase